jgi:putative hydrolase of the HAD superfamily
MIDRFEEVLMSTANQIQVVLFDLGGVLIELTGVPTMLSWAKSAKTPEQLWVQWLTSPAVRAFETGRIGPRDFAEQLIEEMALPVQPVAFIEAFTAWPKGLFPGAMALIERIPSHYTRAALSNSNAIHWPRLMHDMGLDGVFEHTFASHLMGKLKPDPEVFEHVVETLDCAAPAVLFMDDNRLNVEAARAAGMQAVEVAGPQEAEQALAVFQIITP